MKISLGREFGEYAALLGILGLGIIGLGVLGALAEQPTPYDYPPLLRAAAKTPETAIQDWPEHSRAAALALIEKYGAPRRFDEESLAWFDNGPWVRTVVYRTAPRSFIDWLGKNVVEQSIDYSVPERRIPDLKHFDGRLKVDPSTGALSSRAETEELNFLAVNLAGEIVAGKRTATEARGFYRKTVRLSESGKSSEYMQGIIFSLRVPR